LTPLDPHQRLARLDETKRAMARADVVSKYRSVGAPPPPEEPPELDEPLELEELLLEELELLELDDELLLEELEDELELELLEELEELDELELPVICTTALSLVTVPAELETITVYVPAVEELRLLIL